MTPPTKDTLLYAQIVGKVRLVAKAGVQPRLD